MELYLTYGLHKESKKMISVEEAERGLSCNCVCPECNGDLVKKDRGEFGKRRAHFAHYRNTEYCTENKAYESALHKLGKQILSENKSVFLPEYSEFSDLYGITLPSKKIGFETIYIEKRIEDLIPDIIGTNENLVLWIELVNTHYIDSINSDKLQKVRDRGIECVEIDLKGQNLDNLKEFLLNSDENRYWINSPKNQIDVEVLYQNKMKEKEERAEQRKKEREEKLADFKNQINEWKKEGCIEYSLNGEYNRPFQCQKYKNDLVKMKAGRLYTHPIIKSILDGKKDTNGKIYGIRDRHYIFYKNNKYQIYENPFESNPALLYAGLKRIEEIRELSCYECEFNKLNSMYFPSDLKDGISICFFNLQ